MAHIVSDIKSIGWRRDAHVVGEVGQVTLPSNVELERDIYNTITA